MPPSEAINFEARERSEASQRRTVVPTVGVIRSVLFALLLFPPAVVLPAQELQPRAYLPAPVGLVFFSISYSGNSGGLLFDPGLPVEDGHVSAGVPSIALGGTLAAFGRTSQVLAVLPYVVADLSGKLGGLDQSRHRSGLADSTFRFSINIHGAPAMDLAEFAKYRPKTIIGASLTVTSPTGQYDPSVLVNLGANRWAFKPEIGVSRFVGKWDFEAAFGAWLYTNNSDFYGRTFRSQDPLGSVQGHVVRALPRRTWLAFDATFYTGGRSYVGTKINADYEGNTRVGATFGIALDRRQALRFAYFDGVTDRVGADIRSLSIAYQVILHDGR